MLHFMQESPLISVIVPVYKVEQYLARCLESICGQTYRNLEIICVDDGSPDKSIDILNEFADRDSRIRVIRQTNQGQAAARNTALAVAKGDWISFVDSDDWVETNTYEICLSQVSNEIDVLVFSPLLEWEEGFSKEEREKIKKVYDRYFYSGLNGLTIINDDVIFRTDGTVWNKLFRHSLIKKHKLTFPAGHLYEDISFVLRFFLTDCRTAYYLPESQLYHYRQRKGSTMNETRGRAGHPMDYLAVIRDLHSCLKEKGIEKKHELLLARIADTMLSAAVGSTPRKERKKILQEGGKVVEEVGIAHHTEYEYISTVNRSLVHRLSRLFYRRRLTKREWGLFGLMIFAIQNKNGMNVGRLFGIRLWTKPEKKQN